MNVKESNIADNGSKVVDRLRRTFAIGGIAALLSALGALVDIGVGMATGGSVSAIPHDAVGRFAELVANPLLGLYHLDLLNLVTTLLMVPVLYACWHALRRESTAAGLALAVGIIGVSVFIANNAALPMLGLSEDYASADAPRRALLAAAGEAVLAKGAHGTPGVIAGFLLATVANLLLSGAMLETKVFSRATAILGLCGNLLLGVYLVLVTLLPRVQDMALFFAAPGGLMAIAWMLLMTARLFRLSHATQQV